MDTKYHNENVYSAVQSTRILHLFKSNLLKIGLVKYCRVRKFTVNSLKNNDTQDRKGVLNSYLNALYSSDFKNPYFNFCCGCVRWLIKTLSGRHSPPPWDRHLCINLERLEGKDASEVYSAVLGTTIKQNSLLLSYGAGVNPKGGAYA